MSLKADIFASRKGSKGKERKEKGRCIDLVYSDVSLSRLAMPRIEVRLAGFVSKIIGLFLLKRSVGNYSLCNIVQNTTLIQYQETVPIEQNVTKMTRNVRG